MAAEAEQYHIFFWDTETTGLFQYAHPPAILDLAVVDHKNGDLAQWLINPGGVHISSKAREVHGIDMSMVSACENFGQVAVKMFDFLRTQAGSATPILCGFNSHRFDNLVLLAELARYGLEFPQGWLFADLYPHLQQRASRHRGPLLLQEQLSTIPNRKLTTIYEALVGDVLHGAHRAAADAIALQAVWKRAIAHHPDFQLPTINVKRARGKRWDELRVRSVPHPHGPSRPAASPPPVPDTEPVDRLRGIGPKTRTALEASGVATVGALRGLFAGRLGGSAAALGAHIRGALRVQLSEKYVLAIAEQLAAPPPPPPP
jgi:DNA polymerase III epsilon subunit-like protein